MAYGLIRMGIFLLSLLIRAASALGLLLPLLYALIVPTVFQSGYHEHLLLAEALGWMLLALSLTGRVFRLVRR